MASTTLAEISRSDLLNFNAPTLASITDLKHLSSYNWIEAPTPTIAVPGSPALWSALSTPRKLDKDSGFFYIAQNAARHPESPLEPLFRALYITNPSFDIRSIDVVTDRNNIRKLLSFVNPNSSKDRLEAFTINIEGFGHEFEKEYTTNQISGSTGHHRIISYRFGDLNFIVRHETDGYLGASVGIPSSSKESHKDVLSNTLESLSLSSTNSPPETAFTGSKLTVKQEGQVIPLESTLEIKTRVFHKPLDIHHVMPQLWVSQTPKLVQAYHKNGTFETPEVEDVVALIKRWEKRNQTHLRKLATLMDRILGVVKGCGGSAIIKYDGEGDKLAICKVNGEKMLPMDLYSKWDDKDVPEAEANTKHDAAAESAAKPLDGLKAKAEGKSMVSGPEDPKGKKAEEVAEEEE